MEKRLLSLVLVLVMAMACLPPALASALTTNDAVAWMNEHEGWYIDFDNAYGGQCVDVPMRYCHDLFGWNPGGNACDYRSNYLPDGWQRFQYSAGMIPQPGDIVVYQPNWGDPIWTGEFGHVGLVYSASASGMVTMEQNTGEGDPYGGTRVRKLDRSYGGVWGFIRPPFSNNGSVTAPADSITLDLPWVGFATDDNAQIGSFIRNGGAVVGCSSYGLQVWEKSTGNRIVNHSEDISATVQQMTEIKIWNNLTSELGVTLKPGTEYEFQFSATKGGKTYYSDKNTFKTTGQAPNTAEETQPKPSQPEPDTAASEVHFSRVNIYHQDQFTDVRANQWYTDSVASAFELGLMKGDSATTFNPNGDVTVAEAITMACRIHAIYTTGSDSAIPSQSSGAWYQPYLDYALQNGIIDKAYYNSDVKQKATRAQFAEIFANSLPDEALSAINAIADNKIPDVPMNAYYTGAVYKLYRAGILTGGDALGTFSPSSYINRKEAATIVSRMAESNERKSFTL